MHLAEGGFKIINGPPKNGKGPMIIKEISDTSNEVSQPQPTQAGRIRPCQETINKAMKCLENNNRECVMKKIEELVRNQCHDGRLIGKEVADGVREVVHELWLVSNHEEECRLLRILRDLGVSKSWVRIATRITNLRQFNERLERCGIDWENKAVRYEVVKEIEDLLRRLGWDEVKMCEEMWRFVSVDVDEFRKYGIEPCSWLNGLEKLGNLKNPYWFGLTRSDLVVRRREKCVELILGTTNSIDAIFFAEILNTVRTPSLKIEWKRRAPAAKYVFRSIVSSFYIALGVDEWPWSIELDVNELERILNSLSNEELAMFIAGLLDGDGDVLFKYNKLNENETVQFKHKGVFVAIAACPKKTNLDVLKKVIAERFGIIGNIYSRTDADINVLVFYGRNAIKLLRRIAKYMHHSLRRLRTELILAYYDGKISRETLIKLYKQTEYRRGEPDIKHNHAVDALTQAAPQTHTHGGYFTKALRDACVNTA